MVSCTWSGTPCTVTNFDRFISLVGQSWRQAWDSPSLSGAPLCSWEDSDLDREQHVSPVDPRDMRSPVARAQALSSAKSGAEHWWAERVSAVALVPLTLWLVVSMIALADSDYATFIAWLSSPLATILTILLLIASFHHTAFCLQVVVEDYIHSEVKFAAVMVVRLGCFALASAGIVATLRIAMGG